jgi:uncharacterized repeat protein (TIGR04138 family)
VNQLILANEMLDRIRTRRGSFDERAFLFVLATVQFLQGRLSARRHVTGPELAWACRDYALEQYGLLAKDILEYWGVRKTRDFGQIVFALVDLGLLITQPSDRQEDFDEVFQFTEAFDAAYVWHGVTST